jgi:hypothetical protein
MGVLPIMRDPVGDILHIGEPAMGRVGQGTAESLGDLKRVREGVVTSSGRNAGYGTSTRHDEIYPTS